MICKKREYKEEGVKKRGKEEIFTKLGEKKYYFSKKKTKISIILIIYTPGAFMSIFIKKYFKLNDL